MKKCFYAGVLVLLGWLGVADAQTAYRFNFGPNGESDASGWISAGSLAYHPERGWGWEVQPGVVRKRGRDSDPVRDTLVGVFPATTRAVFRVDLPDGLYRVKAIAFDPEYNFSAIWSIRGDSEGWVDEKMSAQPLQTSRVPIVRERVVEVRGGVLRFELRPTATSGFAFSILNCLEVEWIRHPQVG